MRSVPALLVATLLSALPVSADAATLTGTVSDALTGHGVSGARVIDAATLASTTTRFDGAFALEVEGDWRRSLVVENPDHHRVEVVRVGADRPVEVRLIPREVQSFPDAHGTPVYGVPHHREEALSLEGGELRLAPELPAGAIGYTLPATLPTTIRVGRRFSSTCKNTDGTYKPVQRIDEMTFDEYVAGVVPAEIGVFKSVPGGPDISTSSFETFAILARSYALWWYMNKGAAADWHIDDTACNQRYDDARDSFITQAIAPTAGLILVKKTDPDIIDKFEYAASCGRNGTRPEYQSTLVPDVTGTVGCTNGGWCGHDGCAAHEDNPELPGTDKCLVRGTCQWGSLEWAMVGKSYPWILEHYEPNLTLRDMDAAPSGTLLGLVRDGDIQTGANIAGATVSVVGGPSMVTGDNGLFKFPGLAYGTWTFEVSAPGYEPVSRTRDVSGPGDHWASVALTPVGTGSDGGSGGTVDAGGGSPPDDGGTTGSDAGSGDSPDAGAPEGDGGPGGGGGGAGGGCGCGPGDTSPTGAALWLVVLALTTWSGRRRA